MTAIEIAMNPQLVNINAAARGEPVWNRSIDFARPGT